MAWSGIGAVLGVVALIPAAQARPAGRTERSPEAAYLEAAFAHDLCTRDDRRLRALDRALTRSMRTPPARGRTAGHPAGSGAGPED